MEEEYRQKLVSVSLSDTTEAENEYFIYSCIRRSKKNFRCIVKTIKKLFSCFSQHPNKEI